MTGPRGQERQTTRRKKAIAMIPNRLPVDQRAILMSASPVPVRQGSCRLAEPKRQDWESVVASNKPEDEGEYGAGDSNVDGAIVWQCRGPSAHSGTNSNAAHTPLVVCGSKHGCTEHFSDTVRSPIDSGQTGQ